MKISVDPEACAGYGVCASVNDEIFDLEGQGPVVVRDDDLAGEDVEDARAAVDSCPTRALSLRE